MSILASAFIGSFVLINAPEEAAASAPAEPAAEPATDGKVRAKEWQIQVAPGAELFVFPWFGVEANNGLIAAGPAAKVGAYKLGWYGGFMVGGGPSLHYGFMKETKEPPDRLHWLTLNGDFMVGGGRYQKFGVYAHMMLGLGIISGYDADTDTKLGVLPGGRGLVGVGGFGHITPKISLGALVDIGFPGTVDALVTATFHFGKTK